MVWSVNRNRCACVPCAVCTHDFVYWFAVTKLLNVATQKHTTLCEHNRKKITNKNSVIGSLTNIEIRFNEDFAMYRSIYHIYVQSINVVNST